MRKPFFLTAAALALFAAPANAAVIQQFKVADWQIGAYTNDQSGRFTHCAASGRYKNGIILLFSVTESLEWAIGFSSPEWNLRQGRQLDIEFRIDGGRAYNVNGRAVSDRLVRATLPDSAELFNQFRAGKQLVARVQGNPEARFNLTNTAAMLTEVLNCAKKNKGYVATNTNPRAKERDTGNDNRPRQNDNSGPSASSGNYTGDNRNARLRDRDDDMPNRLQQDQQPPQQQQAPANIGPTDETRAEAAELATNILRRANIPDFQIQKPEQLTANFRDKYDVVWKAEGITGTLRVLAGPRANTVEKIRADVIATDVAACKGRFASGVVPASGGSQSVTIQTSCDGDPAWSVYYVAVPRRKGGSYLLGIFGAGEAAARLQAAANAYRLVALEVLER